MAMTNVQENKRVKKKASLKHGLDFPLLLTAIILVCFGVVMVFSASFYYENYTVGNPYEYLTKQLMGAAGGFVAVFFIANMDYRKLKKFAPIGLVISVVLLGLVLIPALGSEINGSTRWLNLGLFSLQPAEVAKFMLIFYMAASIAKRREKMQTFVHGILYHIVVLGILCGLIILQPNFSMVICLCLIWYSMMIVGGCKISHLAGIAVIGVVAGYFMAFGADYREGRISSFSDPWADAKGSGYQIIQSLYSIGSGGLFGLGIGNSRQKLFYLPYGESDFIFSIIAEELGFLGVVLLIVLYGVLIWRGVRIALRSPDTFGCMLATGIVASIAIQAAINIAVVTKSIPATGLTLPFISAGLSSLIMMLCGVGVLLSISRQTTTVSSSIGSG